MQEVGSIIGKVDILIQQLIRLYIELQLCTYLKFWACHFFLFLNDTTISCSERGNCQENERRSKSYNQ